jgi:CheY-like chemotaxis protein
LDSFGLKATGIQDSTQAARTIQSDRFDCIFMDLSMPQIGGYQLARETRQSIANRHTPIVFVTGEQDRSAMQQAFAAGGTFFLTKPAHRPQLRSLIGLTRAAMLDNKKRWNVVPLRTAVTFIAEEDCFQTNSVALSERCLLVERPNGLSLGSTVLVSFGLPHGWQFNLAGTVLTHDADTTMIQFHDVSRVDQFRLRSFVRSGEEHN